MTQNILKMAVEQVIKRQKYLWENGSFSPNDGFVLGYLEMAFELQEQLEAEKFEQRRQELLSGVRKDAGER